MARRFHRLLPSKFRSTPSSKSFCASSAPDPATQVQLLEELRKIRVLIQQNRSETAKRHLRTLISLHSVSQLYTVFSQSSPPPNTKPVFTDTLLTVYAESKLPNEAAELYSLVRSDGNFPSLPAFNLFLEALVTSSQFDKTLKIFSDAVDSGVWVDKFSYGKAIQSAVKLGDLKKGLDLMNQMKKCGARPNGFVYNVLIGGLCKERRVDDAKKLFDEMLKRNVAPNRVTYNSLIDGCCKAGDLEGAFNLREKMKNDSVEPTIVTYNIAWWAL
ncbi:UNVERIFIED_CONTAM: Pentatricopeptide repeat-containing protein, mitochondrial [Sesamum latifolium]|uniref:Pentatricopeptide repeat-containing protein, mitochondrial n=1 Tax=Sesamum latifolium TaxID=2727402 RepID=A0AAW2U0K3_9LAMI